MGQTAGRQKTEDQEYFELIYKFPLRPIRSKSELEYAKRLIRELTAEKRRSVDAND